MSSKMLRAAASDVVGESSLRLAADGVCVCNRHLILVVAIEVNIGRHLSRSFVSACKCQ